MYNMMGDQETQRRKSFFLGILSKIDHASGRGPLTWESRYWSHIRVGEGAGDDGP